MVASAAPATPRRRVVIFTETFLPKIDGIVTTLCHVLDELPAFGWEALVVAPGAGPERYAGADVLRTPALSLPFYPEARVGLAGPGTARRIAAFGPDIAHLAGPACLGLSGLVWERGAVPIVATYHTHLADYTRYYRLGALQGTVWAALRAVHNQCQVTLAPSRAVMRELASHGIERLGIWGRGVDAELFHPDRRSAEMRTRLGAREPDDVIALYAGRLAREKGLERIGEVLEAHPRLRLALVGDGPYRRELEARLPRDRTVFAGYLRGIELATAYASADLFVFPSETDTFGNVVLEAMASGLPVVAVAAGGVVDLVQPGITGEMVAPGSRGTLREPLGQLAGSPERRRAYGLAARTSAEARSWRQVTRELVTHYEAAATSGDRVTTAAQRPRREPVKTPPVPRPVSDK